MCGFFGMVVGFFVVLGGGMFGVFFVFLFSLIFFFFKLHSGKLASSITGIGNVASAELLIAIKLVHRQADI